MATSALSTPKLSMDSMSLMEEVMNNQSKIRIRWLNPIAQSHYDEPMGMALKQVANEGTEVESCLASIRSQDG